MYYPPQFHWDLDDLHVSVGPPLSGQPWLLDVDVARPSTGQVEPMLWDAGSPHGLVRRDARRPTRLGDASAQRERDLLILADRGVGDIIQQWRYVDSAAQQFRRVRIRCRPELQRLLDRQRSDIDMITDNDASDVDDGDDAANVCVSLMRLGSLSPDSTQGNAYLTAHPLHVSSGRYRLRVGLNWATARKGAGTDTKSLPAGYLQQIVCDHPDIDWVSVQWGDDERWLDGRPWADRIDRLGCTFADVADLADSIAGLDLLISTDSAPAHIAGALGVPVWMLLSQPCSWRWGVIGPTTPLYGSMRLVRQTTQGDWSGVGAQVSRMLAGILRTTGTSNFLLARPWDDSLASQLESSAIQCDAAAAVARCDSLDEALYLCRDNDDWRAVFVFHPLALLSTLGIRVHGRDYVTLGKVFKAMVDCHGGFSWCSPLHD